MSKLDILVGDEFPLDESSDPRGHWHRLHRHHHFGHHHGFAHRHERRGRRHGIGTLAMLLVLAGLVGLIVEHRLTTGMAYGMIGLGVGLLILTALLRAVLHWRHFRRDRTVA